MPKPREQIPTDDILTPTQLQHIQTDQQKKGIRKLKKHLTDYAKKAHRHK